MVSERLNGQFVNSFIDLAFNGSMWQRMKLVYSDILCNPYIYWTIIVFDRSPEKFNERSPRIVGQEVIVGSLLYTFLSYPLTVV